MKTVTQILGAVGFVMLATACAHEDNNGTAASVPTTLCTSNCISTVTTTGAGTGTDSTVTGYQNGSTSTLLVTGSTGAAQVATLQQMFYQSNPAAFSNPRVSINVNGGVVPNGDTESLVTGQNSVIISYTDSTTGVVHQASFGTNHPYSTGVHDSSLNKYYAQSGATIWKGFFQDMSGAIVLIIDGTSSDGDGLSAGLSGSVWFQNFNRNPPNDPYQGSQKMCWQISIGPYDCRTFLVGSSINMTSSYYPNNKGPNAAYSYQELGTFDDLDASAAGL